MSERMGANGQPYLGKQVKPEEEKPKAEPKAEKKPEPKKEEKKEKGMIGLE